MIDARQTPKQMQEQRDGVHVLNQYRCTRNEPYMGNCPGNTDITARQGYYITAATERDAKTTLKALFPDDTEGFTATLWKENVQS